MGPYRHAIVIGGTGMLRAASIELAARSEHLTSVARTRASLRALDAALRPGSGLHHPLPLDWSDPDGFIEGIRRHLDAVAPPDIVVAWTHDDQLALRLASRITERVVPCRFFHLIGSASADPARIADSLSKEADLPGHVRYHQVILGAKWIGMKARWLTDDEISAGVLAAIEHRRPRFVVGSLERYR